MESVSRLSNPEAKTCECGMPTFIEYDSCRQCQPQKEEPKGGFDKAPWKGSD